MKIKVCGITSLIQLQDLQQMGVDYAGFIFYQRSKRYAVEKLKNEKEEIKNCSINKVGVFVNADFNTVVNAIKDYGLHAVQLHGDETDEYCLEIMSYCKVIKVFRIYGDEEVDQLIAPFQNACDYFLFDTGPHAEAPVNAKLEYGGTGKKFDWDILKKANINKPFFLSGGIGFEDVKEIKSLTHPFLYAIDINSRFEIEPGLKDITRVAQFVKEVR